MDQNCNENVMIIKLPENMDAEYTEEFEEDVGYLKLLVYEIKT